MSVLFAKIQHFFAVRRQRQTDALFDQLETLLITNNNGMASYTVAAPASR